MPWNIRLVIGLFLLFGTFEHIALGQADLEYGKKQMTQMLSDCHGMTEFTTRDGQKETLPQNSPIWLWATEAYGTPIMKMKVEWGGNHVSKPEAYLAEHRMPHDGQNGSILIRESYRDSSGVFRKATCEELWAACVFELINLRNDPAFTELYQRALNNRINRQDWVDLNTRLEHQALLQLKQFHEKIWLPWAKGARFDSDRKAWYADTPERYETWIEQYQKSSHDPYTYWGDYYDSRVVPYLTKTAP